MNPWNAGTLEWVSLRDENWGVRSVPHISSRYPVWGQPGLVEEIRAGAWYLPDAEEGRRETLITSVLDADPQQVLRIAGPSWLPMASAVSLGGVFIALTFHWWLVTIAFGAAFLVPLLVWIWTGTAEIPEKPTKDVRRGMRLPLYVSGQSAVGWWGMFITMTGDATAFASLVFGYFFYWTIHPDLAAGHDGPGVAWPMLAGLLLLLGWAAMLAARALNSRSATGGMRTALVVGAALTVAGSAAGLAGPWFSGLDPTSHVYPAIVWILVLWSVVHAGAGAVMQLYCLARSFAGRLTPEYDADLRNSTLYFHFLAATALVTFAVVGLFPLAL
jgi:cytochrome c oxidase subunit I+III